MKKRVIIIGAGPAGLTAAWELTRMGNYEVTILEQSQVVGGMAKTVSHNEAIMDVGGHRFYSKEKAVLDWWKAVFQRRGELSEFLLRNRVTSIYYGNHFFDYPISLNVENIKKLGFKKAVEVGASYIKSCIKPAEEHSLEEFYSNRFGKKLYSLFFETYTQKLCGTHPKRISPKWGEERVRGLSIGKIWKAHVRGKGWQTNNNLLSPSLFYYPKHGPGQLWEAVAEEIVQNGGTIRLNCQVESLHQKSDGSIDFVIVKGADGLEQISGDIFVSSMPLRELVAGLNLVTPQVKYQAERLPYRSFVSMGLWVDKLKADIPDCWIYIQDERVKVCRIQFYRNWSPYLNQRLSQKEFIALEFFCDEGDAFWNLSEEECRDLAVKEAVLLGILEENVQVLDWHRERISQAYPGYYDGYCELDEIKKYLAGIENMFCIGRNGLHEYWNMDKCMLSAWNAVEKIQEKYGV